MWLVVVCDGIEMTGEATGFVSCTSSLGDGGGPELSFLDNFCCGCGCFGGGCSFSISASQSSAKFKIVVYYGSYSVITYKDLFEADVLYSWVFRSNLYNILN